MDELERGVALSSQKIDAQADKELKNSNILIIEDEELVQALVNRYVKGLELPENPSLRPLSVPSGWDFLTADLSHIRVAIVDILLPQITGVDLIRSFRERFPHMGIVPITGMATEPMRRQLKEILNNDFQVLDKPLRKNSFQDAFKKAWYYQAVKDEPSQLDDAELLKTGTDEEPLWTAFSAKTSYPQEISRVKKILKKSDPEEE